MSRFTTALALALCAPMLLSAQEASISPSGTVAQDLSWAATDIGGTWSESVRFASGLELGLDGRDGPIRFQTRLNLSVIHGIMDAQISRLWLRYALGPLALTAGRQAINWGRGLLWSPADLFASMPTGIAGMERSGSDAMRLAVAFGDTGSAEAVAVYSQSLWESRYGARVSGTLWSMDLGIAAAIEPALGVARGAVDLRLDGAIGFWAEAAWEAPASTIGSGRLQALAGLDWSLGKLTLCAEYRYAESWADEGRLQPLAPWPGRHLAYARAAFSINELAVLSISAIADLEASIFTAIVGAGLDIAQGTRAEAWISGGNGMPQNAEEASMWSAGLLIKYSFL